MRPLEAAALVVALAALLAALPVAKLRPRVRLALAAAGALLAPVEAALEGLRWQLFPVYLVLGFLAVSALLAVLRPRREPPAHEPRRWPRILAIIGGLLVLALSAALAVVLPAFSLEPPTGAHAVGTTSFEWVDARRTGERAGAPGRRLVVQIWYPAERATALRPEPYLSARVAPRIAGAVHLPPFTFGYLALIPTHAAREASMAESDKPFPILFFSHGLGVFVNQNTFQVEELASHGYVVVGINHTQDAAYTAFNDGTGVPMEERGDMSRLENVDKVASVRLEVWVDDARFVLDQVSTLNEKDARFKGRLDLDRVGYFGHSLGGATALASLAAEPRFRAGMNMDGAHFGRAAGVRPSQPFFLMTGQHPASDAYLAQAGITRAAYDAYMARVHGDWDRACQEGPGARYRLEMAGVDHLSFSDMSLVVPLLVQGSLPPVRVHRLINDYTLAFFDTHLRGRTSPVLTRAATDPAVTFTAFEPRH